MNRNDDQFSEHIGQRLRDSEDQLDELTLARLRAARLHALEAARPARPRLLAGGLAGAATVAALALAVWWMQPATVATPPLEDLQLLSAGEDLQLMEELDFYLWLEYGQQELG